MELFEVSRKKTELENNIGVEVQKFIRETGAKIKNIEVTNDFRGMKEDGEIIWIPKVEIEIIL